MSLATRCTHCGTIFKVVEDQLKVSEGWVRCGRCQEVFHAAPSLFDLDTEAPPWRGPPSFTPQAERDNPPSQPPSEWPSTQPAAQAGELGGWSAPPGPSPSGHAVAGPAAPSASPTANGARLGPRVGPQPAPPQTRSWLAPVPATTEFDLDTQGAASPADAAHAPVPAAAPAPITPGLDDIELDTAVPLSPRPGPLYDHGGPPLDARPAPVSQEGTGVALSLHLSPMGSGQGETEAPDDGPGSNPPPDWANHSRIDLVPSTEESDALDSRYLLPSSRRDRPAARRASDTPDFADAEFPSDWLLVAEEDERAAQAEAAREAEAAAAAQAARAEQASQQRQQAEQARQAARAAAEAAARLMGKPQVPPAEVAPSAHAPSAPAASVQRHTSDHDDGSTVPSQFLDELEGLSPPTAAATPPLESAQAPAAGPSALRRKRKPGSGDEAAPGFLQQAQAQARWRHPAVRAALSIACLALLATLALQVVHQFRDLIAAHHAPARPLLAQWCAQVGCTLQPPLRIEDLQVDSLSFVRATSEGPDAYRLTVVLHNKAPIDLAWPDIDLSLTDTNGAVLIRRVFSAKDASWQDSTEPTLTTPGVPTPAAAPAQRSTTLQWRLNIAQLQPAGYTADIFYP